MNGIIKIIKIFAAMGVLGILIALIFYLKDFQNHFAQPVRLDKIEKDATPFKRGEREFGRAVELIAMGRLKDAREKLLFIQNLHADSEFGPEARRILGEINLDEILSVENMENKSIHVVRAGDTFHKIANQYETTLDCLMFLNGLLDVRKLHPGDELIVMPLDFKIIVDLQRGQVKLYYRDSAEKAHIFAKEYPILKADLSKLGQRSIHTSIRSKVGEVSGRAYQPIHSNYRNGSKVLGIKVAKRNTYIRSMPRVDEVSPGGGIFLSDEAMEELAMLIRFGNEVEVKPAR